MDMTVAVVNDAAQNAAAMAEKTSQQLDAPELQRPSSPRPDVQNNATLVDEHPPEHGLHQVNGTAEMGKGNDILDESQHAVAEIPNGPSATDAHLPAQAWNGTSVEDLVQQALNQTSLAETGSDPHLPADLRGLQDPFHEPWGSTLAPAVTIDPNAELPFPNESTIESETPYLDSAPSISEAEAPRIQAFAKLEFDDGSFYMNTYSVELGRDIRAARLAAQRDFETPIKPEGTPKAKSSSGADVSQTPQRPRPDGSVVMGSVVSERGGIMGLDSQEMAHMKRKKKSKKSKSESSSSRHVSRKNSINQAGPQKDYQSLAMQSVLPDSTLDAQPVDPVSHLPSPDECPLIPVHPPAASGDVTDGHRGISRKHVKIAFNFDKHLFELEVKGKNGAFLDDHWYGPGDIQPLKSGSNIQIGTVGVRFLLPDVALGETGAESYASNAADDTRMSFDFEDAQDSVDMSDSGESDEDSSSSLDSSEEPRARPRVKSGTQIDEEEEEESSDAAAEEADTRPKVKVKLKFGKKDVERAEKAEAAEAAKLQKIREKRDKEERKAKEKRERREAKEKDRDEEREKKVKEEPAATNVAQIIGPDGQPMIPPKRRGPGRPPKDGIMSKREKALIAREAKMAAKAQAQGLEPSQLAPPMPVAKPSTDSDPGAPQEEKPEKRKYTKRKKPGEEGYEGPEPGEGSTEPGLDSSVPPAPKKEKPPKPPRSPSPVWDESKLTEEDMAKPQQSYVVLIHEALTNSKTGAMSLPQIYRAIERKYPYYKLRVTTQGWQSSVRHNLSQHHAFQKLERDGKGWMWGVVPGVSIEKERKRRPSPPPQPTQPYMQQPPPGMPPHQYPVQQPNGYRPMPPGQQGMPPNTYQGPYQPPRQPWQPGMPPPTVNVPMPPQAAPPPTNYRSPYATSNSNSQAPQAPSQLPPPIQQGNGQDGFYSNSPIRQSQPPPPHQPQQQPPPQPPAKSANFLPPQTSQPQPPPQPRQSAPPQPEFGQEVLGAIDRFKQLLMETCPELLVTTAINRVLNRPPPTQTPLSDRENSQVKAIMGALQNMLGNMKLEQNRTSTPQSQAQQGQAARQGSQSQTPAPHLQPPPPPPPQQTQGPATGVFQKQIPYQYQPPAQHQQASAAPPQQSQQQSQQPNGDAQQKGMQPSSQQLPAAPSSDAPTQPTSSANTANGVNGIPLQSGPPAITEKPQSSSSHISPTPAITQAAAAQSSTASDTQPPDSHLQTPSVAPPQPQHQPPSQEPPQPASQQQSPTHDPPQHTSPVPEPAPPSKQHEPSPSSIAGMKRDRSPEMERGLEREQPALKRVVA